MRLAATATSHADAEEDYVEEQLDDGDHYLVVAVHCPVGLVHVHHNTIRGEQVR